MAVVAGVQASLGLESAAFVTGLNQATAAMNNMASNANNAANNVNQSFAKVSQSTRRMRGEFQNLGFQIQDVVVSLQMGMDPIRVFTQQAGQIAQIFGPMGAAIGILVTVMGAFAGVLLNSRSELDEATEATKRFTAVQDQMRALIESATAALKDQAGAVDTLSGTAKDIGVGGIALQLEQANLRIESEAKKLVESLDALETDILSRGGLGQKGLFGLGEAVSGMLGRASAEGVPEEIAAGVLATLEEIRKARERDDPAALAASVAELSRQIADQSLLKYREDILKMAAAFLAATSDAKTLKNALDELSGSGEITTKAEALSEVDLLFKGWDKVAAAEKHATEESERAAKTRDKALADIKVEQEQLKRVGDAYGQNAKAVRDAEVANAAQNKARQAGIAVGSKEYQQILRGTDAIRTQTDANKASEEAIKKANQEKERQAKATKDFNVGLNDTLELQKLLLGGLDKESEAYKVQERLLKARTDLGRDLTAQEQERITLIEQQAIAIDKQAESAKEMEKLWDNMAESMQSALADTFEDIFRNGVTSFQDLADSVTDIFVRMAAELAAKKLMEAILDPSGFMASLKGLTQTAAQQAAVSPAMAPGGSLAGWQQGLSGGPAAYGAPGGFMGTGVAGSSLAAAGIGGAAGGFALGQTAFKGHTGATVGATVGGGLGAAAGMALTGGSPLGAAAGGMLGSIAGGFIGRQFGGGGQTDNRIRTGGGILGTAGLGGTGAGAQFIQGIDQSLIGLLTARQEAIISSALAAAPREHIRYDKTPSANDLSLLAASRIGPAAAALGLDPTKIAGQRNQFTGEQQFANLQTAIGLLKQFESFRIGPVATQFRDLNDQFAELQGEATRLGVSTDGLAEAQAKANQQLRRETDRQVFQIAGAVGAMSDLNVQLNLLNVDMQEAGARAKELGVPLSAIRQQHIRLAEALIRQNRAQEIAISAAVGNITPLNAALLNLSLQMQEAYAEATRLGISTANLAKEHNRLAQSLIRQSRSEYFNVAEKVGAISPLGNALQQLNLEMQEAAARAKELGVPLGNISAEHRRLAAELIKQHQATEAVVRDRRREIAIALQVGAIAPLNAALQTLQIEMQEARAEATRLGISTAKLARTHQLAAYQLQQEERQRVHGIMLTVGATTELGAAVGNFDAQMRIAAGEAERAGISLGNFGKTLRLGIEQLYQEDRIRRHAIGEAVGIWTPLERALGDLDAQMKIARIEAERLGYSTAGLAREHHRLAAAIIREHEATIDAMARSIVDPFKRMLDPLKDFFRELTFGNLNPAGQMKAAGDEFRRIAEAARAGSTVAIGQLEAAGRAYIAQSERFGASPAGAAARTEVQSVVESVMADIGQAQREASAGLEDAISRASQREVDTLREVIAEVRLVGEEIKRLRR